MRHGIFTHPPNTFPQNAGSLCMGWQRIFFLQRFYSGETWQALVKRSKCIPSNRDSRIQQSNAWSIPAEESNLSLVKRRYPAKRHRSASYRKQPVFFESIKRMKGRVALLQSG